MPSAHSHNNSGSHSPLIPLLCLAGAVIFWGTSFVATKSALAHFSPMTVIWLRMVIATIVFAPAWFFLPKPAYQVGDVRWLALVALLQPCIYYLAEGYAVKFTTSAAAGVISAIVPLLVAAGAWLFLRERLSARSAVAIGVSLAGVAVLSSGGAAQATAPNPLLGNLLEVVAMVAAAGSMIAIKHLSSRYGAWFITGMQATVGCVFFLPGALLGGVGPLLAAPASAWLAVAYLGTFVSLGAFGLYNMAVVRMPANKAALAINLVPAVALIAGWAMLDESLSPVQLGACAAIVGSVVFAEMTPRKRNVVAEALAEQAATPIPEAD